MEILDYFKAIGRRFWVLVLVPAVLGVLPVAWYVLRPAQYQAKVTVIPTALVGGLSSNQYRGSDADKQFAANVGATAKTHRLVDQVAAETKVPAARVRSGLKVQQVNTSAFVDFTFTTSHRREAVPVARAAAADTLRFLFQSQYDLAVAEVDAAQKQIDKAENGLQALSTTTGGQTPEVAYAAVSRGLGGLHDSAARAKNPAATAQIEQTIQARDAQLADLAQKQGEYLAFVDIRRRAVNLRRQSQQTLRQAQAQLAAAEPGRALHVGKSHRALPVKDILQAGVGAAAGGLFLAVGWLLLGEVMEVVRSRTRQPAVVPTG
jgi:capsular polysaccharide biosynthesis protein